MAINAFLIFTPLSLNKKAKQPINRQLSFSNVEAYYATVAAVPAAVGDGEPVTLRELRKAASEQFERAQLLGEVDRREAANPVTFANAVDLLVRRRILETGEKTPKGEEAFVRGDGFGDLPALRERLAGALSAR